MTRQLLGVDPTQITAAGEDSEFNVGVRAADVDGNVYVYCKAGGTIAAQTPASLAASFIATASGNGGVIDGVTPAAVVVNEHFWLQVSGLVENANVNTATTLGMLLALIADSNGDLQAIDNDSTTDGLGHVRAKALEADTAGLADVLLYSHF